MGFLKRIFSIGSKKNKKQRLQIVHNVDAAQRAIEEEEHEAAVGRLLRSSSTRYTVVSEVEIASLPPLPHPINNVIQPPAASTISLASSTISQRGTYNVTVHQRKQHTVAEFPTSQNAIPERPLEPVQSNQSAHLLELRTHPSVVSLLDMYDEQGRLPPQAFSNSPPSPEKTERAQTRRSGSTLRQLLGKPLNSGNDNAGEGDISWAERFLGESDSLSSAASSVDCRTPPTPNAPFHGLSNHHNHSHDISFATDHDLSMTTYENPAISSMEVELSTTESLPHVEEKLEDKNPYMHTDPATPQRASRVFGFLTERTRRQYTDDQERSLPELPSAFSISSDEGSSPGHSAEGRSHFSDDSFDVPSALAPRPAIPIPKSSDTFPDFRVEAGLIRHDTVSPQPSLGVFSLPPTQVTSDPNPEPTNVAETVWVAANLRKAANAPTRVIVTAPTPSGKHNTPSRIPRGPRAQSRRLSASHHKVRRATTLAERSSNTSAAHSVDTFTPVPSKHHPSRRTSSSSSTRSRNSQIGEIGMPTRLEKRSSSSRGSGARSILTELNKENGAELNVKYTLPSTPMRSKSDSKSLFRTVVTPSMFRPPAGMIPSPASSSDLSPVGKQMMINVRQQRSKAREQERQKTRGRFGVGVLKD